MINFVNNRLNRISAEIKMAWLVDTILGVNISIPVNMCVDCLLVAMAAPLSSSEVRSCVKSSCSIIRGPTAWGLTSARWRPIWSVTTSLCCRGSVFGCSSNDGRDGDTFTAGLVSGTLPVTH